MHLLPVPLVGVNQFFTFKELKLFFRPLLDVTLDVKHVIAITTDDLLISFQLLQVAQLGSTSLQIERTELVFLSHNSLIVIALSCRQVDEDLWVLVWVAMWRLMLRGVQ